MTTMTATTTRRRPLKKGTGDEKHHKRRKQKTEERLRHAIMLFGVALIMLIYTWWSLLEIPEVSESEAYPHHPATAGHSAPQSARVRTRSKRVRPDNNSTKEEEEVGSLLGGVGKLFRNKRMEELEGLLQELDESVRLNKNNGIRWVRPGLMPNLDSNEEQKPLLQLNGRDRKSFTSLFSKSPERFFSVKRTHRQPMAWEDSQLPKTPPTVDFTQHSYEYPEKLMEPPATLGAYPKLTPMKEIMETWPQDEIDNPPATFQETLIHFDYTNPEELEAAAKFRDAKLPFKLINVPEVMAAGDKWTDEYVADQFDNKSGKRAFPSSKGSCQESPDNYFAFFAQGVWPVEAMGMPPTRNNDWTYEKWAQHARYADTVGLDPHQPHFYWQSGVDRGERELDYSEWTFISRDLPSFSSPTRTFFVFEPESQKGIQCRFGERGVTAATHFDAGRNMIAMMTGAKRYILSPPKQCSKLGIVTQRGNAIFRHSMLNFGHLNHMDDPDMPQEEREWMERSGDAMAIDTILKAGEVLYIPSHWFHYITSLQKSAQCNVRSGVDVEGDDFFGGKADVTLNCEPV
jgi:hypothetical protein